MLYTDERIADVMIPVGCTDSASDAYDTAIMLCKQMRDSYEVALTALKSDARHAAQGTQRAEATIATQAAEIERLKAQMAQTWQPVSRSDIKISFFVSEVGQCLVTWPDDIRLCRQAHP